ncbi:hypothetical protein BJY01DRAFT_228009 [Aspergillus pseudoustus]|uniref:Uncharacterized protein n=1 Tax=Aspergillus pseudoustus TaxID=1810923 RepID=A0ABR4IQH0_9EURO
MPPILPTDLLRCRLPCHERLWDAPTAATWWSLKAEMRMAHSLSKLWTLTMDGV